MADQAERIILEAEDQVSPSVAAANAGLDSFEKKAISSHGRVIQITDQSRSSVQRLIASHGQLSDSYVKNQKMVEQYSTSTMHGTEAIAALAAMHASAIYQIAKYTVATAASASATEHVATSVRGARLAYASYESVIAGSAVPLYFAASTVAAGLLVEQTVKLVAARARLIDQQALFAATNHVSFSLVDSLDAVSKAGGTNQGNVRSLYTGLQSQWQQNQSGVQDALNKLGATGNVGDPAILGRIAAGFQSIADPARQAEIAVQLFGSQAGMALADLDTKFVLASDSVDKYGVKIDQLSRTQIHQAAQDIHNQWVEFTDFSVVTARWEAFKTGVEIVVGAIEDASKRGVRAMTAMLSAHGIVPLVQNGNFAPPPGVAGAGAGNEIFVQDALAQEAARQQRQAQTLEGQRALQSSKAAESNAAFTALQTERDPAKRLALTTQALSAQTVSATSGRYVKTLEDAEKAAKDAAAAAKASQNIVEATQKRADALLEQSLGLTGLQKISQERRDALAQPGNTPASTAVFNRAYENMTQAEEAKLYLANRKRTEEFNLSNSETMSGSQIFSNGIASESGKTQEDRLKELALHPELATAFERMTMPQFSQFPRQATSQDLIRGAQNDERYGAMLINASGGRSSTDELSRQSQLSALREGTAEKVLELEKQIAQTKGPQAEQAREDAEIKFEQTKFDIQLENAAKISEIQRQQFDSLKSSAEKLTEVLFTKPKNFAKDLGSVLHQAVLKPAVDAVSSGAAHLLQPLIYGKDGSGGINGMFHPSKDPLIAATDRHIAATNQNSATMATLTAILAAGMGVAAPSMPGGPAGAPTISMPSITAPASFGGGGGLSFSGGSLDPSGILSGGGGVGWSGGGGNVSPRAGGGGFSIGGLLGGRGGGFNLGGALGGLDSIPILDDSADGFHMGSRAEADTSKSGFSGMLGGLKSTFSKGNWMNSDVASSAGGGFMGSVAGALSSKGGAQAEMSVGMPLAMAGLTGVHMGSGTGIAESTLGGALTGAGIGTMILPGIGTAIGAGVGAAAGAAISGAEDLLGIQSPQEKVVSDAKSIYQINLSANSGTVKQIVSMAQSQYGGNIAVAMRSPSVRQLLMLYAESTGQKTSLSGSTPYAGSLVEQGGGLFQQSTYQDGTAHQYASNIPTLGGIGGSNYPTQAGPNTSGGTGMSFALNINGTAISPQFVTDQSMDAQNSSYGRTQSAANLQVPGLMVT